jgi:hypothetical protein
MTLLHGSRVGRVETQKSGGDEPTYTAVTKCAETVGTIRFSMKETVDQEQQTDFGTNDEDQIPPKHHPPSKHLRAINVVKKRGRKTRKRAHIASRPAPRHFVASSR